MKAIIILVVAIGILFGSLTALIIGYEHDVRVAREWCEELQKTVANQNKTLKTYEFIADEQLKTIKEQEMIMIINNMTIDRYESFFKGLKDRETPEFVMPEEFPKVKV
jgi:hypothetical protein